MKLWKIVIFAWLFAVFLDGWSTIILSYQYEENPVVKYVWKEYGDLGFVLFNLIFALIFSAVLFYSRKLKGASLIYSFALLLIVFKIVIALTNFGIIPYAYTAWFSY